MKSHVTNIFKSMIIRSQHNFYITFSMARFFNTCKTIVLLLMEKSPRICLNHICMLNISPRPINHLIQRAHNPLYKCIIYLEEKFWSFFMAYVKIDKHNLIIIQLFPRILKSWATTLSISFFSSYLWDFKWITW